MDPGKASINSHLRRVGISSAEWTERADPDAATQPIPTLAKATRRVCISGDRKISNTKKSGLEELASTKFTQERKNTMVY